MTTFTNKAQEQVKEFHALSKHPVSDKPKSITLNRALGRSSWGSGEELIEFLHASSTNELEFRDAFANLLVGLKQAFQKQKTKPFPKNEQERVVAQVDAIVDRLYFSYGDAVEIGADIQPIFDIVHEANMSKFFTDENGNKHAQYNEEGKVIKSPDFWSPEDKIAEEIKRQLEDVKVEEKPKRKTTRKKKTDEVVLAVNKDSIAVLEDVQYFGNPTLDENTEVVIKDDKDNVIFEGKLLDNNIKTSTEE